MHVGPVIYGTQLEYWSLEGEGERRILWFINKVAYWITKNVHGDDP